MHACFYVHVDMQVVLKYKTWTCVILNYAWLLKQKQTLFIWNNHYIIYKNKF